MRTAQKTGKHIETNASKIQIIQPKTPPSSPTPVAPYNPADHEFPSLTKHVRTSKCDEATQCGFEVLNSRTEGDAVKPSQANLPKWGPALFDPDPAVTTNTTTQPRETKEENNNWGCRFLRMVGLSQ